MATNPDTKAVTIDNSTTAVSSTSEIPSVAVRAFYDSELRYIEEGQAYLWTQDFDGDDNPIPYPYANIHPTDPALDKAKRLEFAAFKKDKRQKIADKSTYRAAMATLASASEY